MGGNVLGDSRDPSVDRAFRKRRVNELFGENVRRDEGKQLSNGKWACLVCRSTPVLDTFDALVLHRTGKRHKEEAQARRQARASGSSCSRHGGNADSASCSSEKTSSGPAPQQEHTRTNPLPPLRRKDSAQRAGPAKRARGDAGLSGSSSALPASARLPPSAPSWAPRTAEDHQLALRLADFGWRRDPRTGQWSRDETVEFDSDEEMPYPPGPVTGAPVHPRRAPTSEQPISIALTL
eukprot:tig00020572_g11581.t1